MQGNVVYSNGVGIRITGGPTAGRTSNNIVYANTTAGILVGAGVSKYQIVNNTVYQPVGDAVRFEGDAGVGTPASQRTFPSATTCCGLRRATICSCRPAPKADSSATTTSSSRPGRASWATGKDAIHRRDHLVLRDRPGLAQPGRRPPLGESRRARWHSRIQHRARRRPRPGRRLPRSVGSPVIDRGDPTDPYLAEPSPNGNRIDVGAYGNTSGATSSAVQRVQVLTPEPLQKIQVGQQVAISWQSSGLTVQRPVALINAGGGVVQNWTAEPVYTGTSVGAFTNPVDTSGVTDPAPQSVYQSYALSASGTNLAYQIQVPDGSYHVRLHFVEPSLSSFVGSRSSISNCKARRSKPTSIFWPRREPASKPCRRRTR